MTYDRPAFSLPSFSSLALGTSVPFRLSFDFILKVSLSGTNVMKFRKGMFQSDGTHANNGVHTSLLDSLRSISCQF
jgi:hypothetical protein